MKRVLSVGAILVLLLVSAEAFAGDAVKPASVQGWITDSFCGANNANAAGAKCAKDCYKNGAKLELIADGKTYQLTDQKMAFENIGHEVVVTGTIDKDTIKVDKIEAAKKDKA